MHTMKNLERPTASPGRRHDHLRCVRAAILVAVLIVAGGAGLAAQALPRPRGFVNDFADVISASDARAMEEVIASLRDQTGAEIAVVTVRTYEPYATIDEFGMALAEAWGVGASAGDTGVILMLALEERRVRLEVGYGLEGAIPDGRAGSLLDRYVVPDLREGNYSAGLLNGVAAITQIVAEEFGVSLTGVSAQARPAARRGAPTSGVDLGDLVYVLFVLLFFGGRWFFWPLLFGRRRRGFFGGGFGSAARGGSTRFTGFGGGGFGGGGASRGF